MALSNRNDNGYYLNIDSYYDKIHRTTWVRRTAGMMAGGTLGAAYGAVVGAIAAFVPYLLGAIGVAGAAAVGTPGLAAIGASVALFAAVTAAVGMLITADVAANAASSATGLEEKEKREKLEQVNGQGLAQANGPQKQETKESAAKGPPMFSWKVAAVTVPIFAAFGALIALNPHTAAVIFKEKAFESITGGSIAAITASAAVFGMFGTFLGMKSSLLTNKLSNFYYGVLSEEIFKGPAKEQNVAEPLNVTTEYAINEPANGKFAAKTSRFSMQSIIDRQEKTLSEDTVRLR